MRLSDNRNEYLKISRNILFIIMSRFESLEPHRTYDPHTCLHHDSATKNLVIQCLHPSIEKVNTNH